jgi:hypothetical protein
MYTKQGKEQLEEQSRVKRNTGTCTGLYPAIQFQRRGYNKPISGFAARASLIFCSEGEWKKGGKKRDIN